MTPAEIKKEWDAFIEYPVRSNRMYVTTTSALLFARYIADMAADKEREACEGVCGELAAQDKHSNYYKVAASAIRARGEA